MVITAGCQDNKPKAPPPKPIAAASPTSAAVSAAAAAHEAANKAIAGARTFGETLGTLYQGSRPKISAVGGSARYWGNDLDRIEVAVSFSAFESGFKSFEYSLQCVGPEPPRTCLVAQAFTPDQVERAGVLLNEIGKTGPLVFRVVGKADAVWKKPTKARLYDGSCGEGECATADSSMSITNGMEIDSNQTLACLRALCVFAQSRVVVSPNVKLELKGEVIQGSASPESRRAEVALFAWLPNEVRRMVWDGFFRLVPH